MDHDTEVATASHEATAAEPDVERTDGTRAGGTPAETGPGETTTKRRRRRRGGRGRGGRGGGSRRAPEHAAVGPEAVRPDVAEPVSAGPTSEAARRVATERADDVPDTSREAVTVAEAAAAGDAAGTPKRRRRRRGGRGRGRGGAAAAPPDATPESQRDDAAPDDAAEAGPDTSAAASSTRSRRRGGGRSAGASAPAVPAPAARPPTLEEQVAAGGPTRGIRAARPRRDGRRRRREPTPTPPRVTNKTMVITEHGDRDQIAVLEDDVLVQHYVTRAGATSMVGNVYLGRVQNVLPGMEAAFVDVGRGRNGVLYAGEVNYAPEDLEGPAPRIEQVLKPGQSVIVQVTKDPMGGKGARLTANVSLAGRYTVLAPDQDLSGISRRLTDQERRRLKSILKAVKPERHGLIVRTAAADATEEALVHDVRRLLATWDEIQKKAKKGKAPTVVYEEPELTVRVVRDLFTDEEFRQLVTDSPRIHERIEAYVRDVAPDLLPKVRLHEGPLAAFEEHRIVEQIHKALDRKVWLPSGGYLIIERTEAMTIIDVNTGKSIGKTNLEETVVNTNLEAAREAARQLRLRDIGGIIVIDFIDMLLEQNKKQVEDAMREALALDKTRSQVFEIGPLGLMQVTRKRVSSGLVESFSETCPHCEGRGFLLTYDVD